MFRGRRSRRLAIVAGLGLGLSLPTTVLAADAIVLPAGYGCEFDVQAQPEFLAEGATADRLPIGFGDITLTNLESGATTVTKSRYAATDTVDPGANVAVAEITGRFMLALWPGDQGPSGEVEYPGMLIRVVGNISFTIDLETEVITAFSLMGDATDLCAELDP